MNPLERFSSNCEAGTTATVCPRPASAGRGKGEGSAKTRSAEPLTRRPSAVDLSGPPDHPATPADFVGALAAFAGRGADNVHDSRDDFEGIPHPYPLPANAGRGQTVGVARAV